MLCTELEILFEKAVVYAVENDIKKIIVFAKKAENILKLKHIIADKDIKILVTTFPMNQVLYIKKEGEIEEVHSELDDKELRGMLEENGIKVLSGTLPLENIIVPGSNNNPYDIIKKTMNLFGTGLDIIVQSALMTTDMGETIPGERIISMNAKTFVDMTTTNSVYLYHPKLKVNINSINK